MSGTLIAFERLPLVHASAKRRLAVYCSFEYSSFGGGRESATCDEDTYARRMWEEMNARAHRAARPSATTAETWGRADEAHEQRRRAAEAADASRRILEDEQAKDRAWRQAVLQVGSRQVANDRDKFALQTCSYILTR